MRFPSVEKHEFGCQLLSHELFQILYCREMYFLPHFQIDKKKKKKNFENADFSWHFVSPGIGD